MAKTKSTAYRNWHSSILLASIGWRHQEPLQNAVETSHIAGQSVRFAGSIRRVDGGRRALPTAVWPFFDAR